MVIAVTRLDGTRMIINSDQIAWIECNPDTVLALMSGEKLIVSESPEALVDRVIEFKRAVADRVRVRPPELLGVGGEGVERW